MRGRYKIMDFKDVKIASTSEGASTTPFYFEGIYEALEVTAVKYTN